MLFAKTDGRGAADGSGNAVLAWGVLKRTDGRALDDVVGEFSALSRRLPLGEVPPERCDDVPDVEEEEEEDLLLFGGGLLQRVINESPAGTLGVEACLLEGFALSGTRAKYFSIVGRSGSLGA